MKSVPVLVLSVILLISFMAAPVTSWCTTAGGVGEYSTECPSSVGKNDDFHIFFLMERVKYFIPLIRF